VASGTSFPDHRHSAAEFYAVVAGTAEWRVDGRSVTLGSTSVIEVPSGEWHATSSSPMLCCYLWNGTVDFDDYEFRDTGPTCPVS